MNPTWNKERIAKLLNASDKAVERAMVTLHDKQTEVDKAAQHTRHGFRVNQAVKCGYYAQWVLDGRKLTGYHLANARQIALQHTQQLADEANAKSDNACKGVKRDAPNSARMIRILKVENDRAQPPVQSDVDVSVSGVSYAHTARMLVELGLMTGDEADAWKDSMKGGAL